MALNDFFTRFPKVLNIFRNRYGQYKFLDWKLMDEPLIEIYERMGIGVKRATVLAEKYPTMFDLVLADEKELNSLPNFGKKTVSKMMKYIKR